MSYLSRIALATIQILFIYWLARSINDRNTAILSALILIVFCHVQFISIDYRKLNHSVLMVLAENFERLQKKINREDIDPNLKNELKILVVVADKKWMADTLALAAVEVASIIWLVHSLLER